MLSRLVAGARVRSGRRKGDCRCFQSTLAVDDDTTHSSTAVKNDHASSSNVFEPFGPEYARVRVRQPRQKQAHPTRALLAALDAGKYDDASALLKDFKNLGAYIIRRPDFAVWSRRLLEERRDSDWIEWFKLANSHGLHSKVIVEREAYRILSRLFDDFQAGCATFDHIHQFAVVCAERGHFRGPMVNVLPFLAAHRPDMAEDVWSKLIAKVQQKPAVGDMKILSHVRNQMIHAASQFFRFDFAVEMLESLEKLAFDAAQLPSTSSSEPAWRIANGTFMWVFSTTGRAERYDLFERAYQVLHRHRPDWRLCSQPVQHHPLSLAPVDQTDEAPLLAQEAFVAFRDASITTHGKNDLFEDEGDELAEETSVASPRPADVTDMVRDAHIKQAVAANDVATATTVLVEMLANGTVPTLDTTALVLDLDHQLNEGRVLSTIMDELDGRDMKTWLKGFWATSLMLLFYRQGRPEQAMSVFVRLFDKSSMPASFVKRFPAQPKRVHQPADVASHGPLKAVLDSGIPLHEHSLCIATHCFVSFFLERRDFSAIDELYDALVNTPVLFPIQEASQTKLPRYDPYTFLPFAKAFGWRQHYRLSNTFELLFTMHNKLGLTIPKPVWSQALMNVSRRASTRLVHDMIDHIEGRKQVKGWPPVEDGRQVVMDTITYTGIMRSFSMLGKQDEALKIDETMRKRGFEEDEIWRRTLSKAREPRP